MKQKKSTVKPPFDPNPYKVTDVKGNRVTMKREDGKKRVRDKNQIKVVKPRPLAIKPSWERKQNSVPTDYASFDIEDELDNAEENRQEEEQSTDDEVLNETDSGSPESSESEEDNEEEEESEEEELFEIDNDEEDRMRLMLEAATANASVDQGLTPVTRSRGIQLKWNPQMNSEQVVIPNVPEQ